jgi:hypothetical protein
MRWMVEDMQVSVLYLLVKPNNDNIVKLNVQFSRQFCRYAINPH